MHYLYCTSSLSNFCNKHNNTKEIIQVGQANNLELILTGLCKSHVNKVWGPKNLPQDLRSFGRFCMSPNSLHMGFTFLMDANTSIFSQSFYGNEVNSNKPLKSKK